MMTILIGISGSGKSTWANSQFIQDPLNTTVINRDKIRELLFGFSESNISDYYKLKDLNRLEKKVTLYENVMIKEALSKGNTIIVDATHFRIYNN